MEEIIALASKRDDAAEMRAREDRLRVHLQKEADKPLEERRATMISTWTAERTFELEQHKVDSTISLDTLKARYAEELVELRKRQAAELSALKRKNSTEQTNVLSSPKTYRWNAQQNNFEPHNGEEPEVSEHPNWVLNIKGGKVVYYDQLRARIAIRTESGWLRVELWNFDELARFMRFCNLLSETVRIAVGISISGVCTS